MSFPDDPLEVTVEAAWGADLEDDPSTWAWIDISANRRLLLSPLKIGRGRRDERSAARPASVSFLFDNGDGNLTPDHPQSIWWPNVRRGTPIRVRVGALVTYLRPRGVNGIASTPDHASLDITGDIDIRIDITPDEWGPGGLANKYVTSGGANQRSWALAIDDTGNLWLRWSPDGTLASAITKTSTVAIPTLDRRLALRATLDVNNGAAGNTVTFYTALTNAGPWTQLGAPVITAGTTSVFSSTAPVEVGRYIDPAGSGYIGFAGRVHGFEVRNGIAGTAVANPDFTTLSPGQTTLGDPAGRTWTVTPDATIESSTVRFAGEIASIEPTWPYGDLSDSADLGEARISITAAGVLRRLGQGQAALQSALRRSIPSVDPVGYWPLEDGETSAYAASFQAGPPGPAFVGGLEFARDATLPGSAPLPTATMDGGYVFGPVVGGTPGRWSTTYVYHATSTPTTPTVVMEVRTTGTVALWTVEVSNTTATVRGYNGAGTQVVTQGFTIGSDVFDGWQWIRLDANIGVGPSIFWTLAWTNVGGTVGGGGSSVLGDPGRITNTAIRTVAGWSYGHLAARDEYMQPAAFPSGGFAGETLRTRLERLDTEGVIDVTVIGDDSDTRLGAQPRTAPVDVARDAVAADLGVLAERRDHPGLLARSRATLYNQAPALVLDAAANEITAPFQPVHDDQRYRNDLTVQRTGGSSYQKTNIGLEGTYDTSITVNIQADSDLPDQAGWRLRLGTWPGMRYPTVSIDLAVAPHLIDAVTALVEGDRIQVINLPPQHPTTIVDLLIEGIDETLTPSRWLFEMACGPAGPWDVWVLEDADFGRADTSGSQLGAGVNATATSWSLVTNTGPVWVNSAAFPTQFPFDLIVDGERVTVTAITSTTSPQTATVTRSVNGVVKSHLSGAAVSLADPAVLAL